jgi:gliding motility-associated lipoprotein GldH
MNHLFLRFSALKICVLFWALGFLMMSCQPETKLAGLQAIPREKWGSRQILEFPFMIQEPGKSFDLLYQVQYRPSYSFENIYLKYWLIGPGQDTLIRSKDNLFLFEPRSGKPIGISSPTSIFLDSYFLRQVRLDVAGKYKVRVQHYMRKDSLEGIQSIGIKLKPVS